MPTSQDPGLVRRVPGSRWRGRAFRDGFVSFLPAGLVGGLSFVLGALIGWLARR